MLKFINNNDFLLVDKYKQNDDGSISWIYNDGTSIHNGFIREGMIRTNGDDTKDIWDSLQTQLSKGKITIEGETQAEIEAKALEALKAERTALVAIAKVTISTGKRFDANEPATLRLGNSVLKHLNDPDDHIIYWSTDDVPTGVMVECTKAEIVEAHKMAVEYMGEVWDLSREKG